MTSALATTAALIGIALVTTACALVDDKPGAEARSPREYRTGSNIPVKDAPPAMTPEEREKQLEQIRQIQQRPGVRPPSS